MLFHYLYYTISLQFIYCKTPPNNYQIYTISLLFHCLYYTIFLHCTIPINYQICTIPLHCIYYTMPFIDSQYHSSLFPEVKHSVTSTIVTDCLLTSTTVRPMMIYAATCHWKSLENEVSALLYSAPIFKRPLGSDYFTIPVTHASSGIHNDV